MAETERPSSNNSGECVHGSHLNLVTWGGAMARKQETSELKA